MTQATEPQETPQVQAAASMSLLLAASPILLLIVALSWNVYVYGDDALNGSSQLIIMLFTGYAGAVGLWRGVGWSKQQKQIVSTISTAMPSILILLLVGALASIWLISGTVPVMVYYGVQLLNPAIFLFACVIICAITSIVSGSSWTTAATIGVAMVAVGRALEIPDGMIGGAIISGSYFGDKISPLSDTTNLAAAVTETPLIEHIKYLFYTTGPSIVISLIIFVILGLFIGDSDTSLDVESVVTAIDQRFNVSLWLLLPPVIVLGLISKKIAAMPALFVGIVLGVISALVFQQELLANLAASWGDNELQKHGGALVGYKILTTSLFIGIEVTTSNESLNDLFISSGMSGMLKTIWLIIAAMAFGGVLEATGMLARFMQSIKSMVSSFFSLVTCTSATCLVTNASTSDQYISVALPGRMYSQLYKEMGYSRLNLSRTLEDTGTVTSVLIPWNTCGAYHAVTLGIATPTYLPFCFFNILSPLMTLVYAWFKIKIRRSDEDNFNEND